MKTDFEPVTNMLEVVHPTSLQEKEEIASKQSKAGGPGDFSFFFLTAVWHSTADIPEEEGGEEDEGPGSPKDDKREGGAETFSSMAACSSRFLATTQVSMLVDQ